MALGVAFLILSTEYRAYNSDITEKAFDDLFSDIDINHDGQMDLYEFVIGVEHLSIERLFHQPRDWSTDASWRLFLRKQILERRETALRRVVVLLLLLQLSATALYGLYFPSWHLDLICHIILYTFVLEMSMKLVVFGAIEVSMPVVPSQRNSSKHHFLQVCDQCLFQGAVI